MTLSLYHNTFCPLSRFVRVLLKELQLNCELIREDYWLRRKEFLNINPSGRLPVLNDDGLSIISIYSIIEYINEVHHNEFLAGSDIFSKTLIRNQINWFSEKFYREITKIIIDEKLIRLILNKGEPRSEYIKIAKANLQQHFKHLNLILSKSQFLAIDHISLADIIAATNISLIDYFGEINWDNWELVKQWYCIIKSRPSFNHILNDVIPGYKPPPYYRALDF